MRIGSGLLLNHALGSRRVGNRGNQTLGLTWKTARHADTADDVSQYQKKVVALRGTIRVMAEIDRTIEQHGS